MNVVYFVGMWFVTGEAHCCWKPEMDADDVL
jgi:hypothetical protein